MKSRLYFPVISVTILVLLLLILSCSTTKKTAVSCPEVSKSRYKVATGYNKNYHNVSAFQNGGTRKNMYGRFSAKHKGGNRTSVNKSYNNNGGIRMTGPESLSDIDKGEFLETMTAAADNTIIPVVRYGSAFNAQNDIVITQLPGCDTIVLKSGAVLIGKVDEIGLGEIKYRRCDNLSGPVILLAISDVSLIKYLNGTRDVLTYDNPLIVVDNRNYNYNNRPPYDKLPPKTEGFATAGLIVSLTGLLIAGIPLGILAVVFGSLSLGKITNNPGKYKGRSRAITAIILGFVDIAGAIIALSMM